MERLLDSEREYRQLLIDTIDWGGIDSGLKQMCIKDMLDTRPYERLQVCEGDFVLDLGATVGEWSLSIQWYKPDIIYAWEPNPYFFAALVKNSKGQNIVPINMALSSFDGLGNSLVVGADYTASQPVSCCKLMTFVKKYHLEKIDFIKTDMEGGEYDLFSDENMFFLLNNVRYIVGEFHLTKNCDLSGRELFRKFVNTKLNHFKEWSVWDMSNSVCLNWELENSKEFWNYYTEVLVNIRTGSKRYE